MRWQLGYGVRSSHDSLCKVQNVTVANECEAENIPLKLAKLFLIVLMAVGSAYAQAPTGTIAGVVTDSAGKPVAGARLRLTNRDSGLTRSLTTSADGDYSAAALPPGAYI